MELKVIHLHYIALSVVSLQSENIWATIMIIIIIVLIITYFQDV